MIKKAMATLVMFTSVLGLAACGAGPSNKLSVTTTDYKFAPMSWTVAVGKPVSLSLKNTGALPHEWVLLKKGTDVTMPFDADDEDKVFWEIEAEPGETKSETFTAPADAGTYKVVCGTPAHLEQGMEATLVVQ